MPGPYEEAQHECCATVSASKRVKKYFTVLNHNLYLQGFYEFRF